MKPIWLCAKWAHSVFNIPLKIARIRHQNYLHTMWNDLYRKDHLPIDPHHFHRKREVANTIINRLHVPGAMDTIPFAHRQAKVVEVRCTDHARALGQKIHELEAIGDHRFCIIGMYRDEEFIIPKGKEVIEADDAIFFISDRDEVTDTMALFGHEEKEARRVLIIGGGNIGFFISQAIQEHEHEIDAKIIELDRKRAEHIAGQLSDIVVIHGSALDKDILEEANISSTETVIAVTNDDEVNILASLLAKQSGCQRAFTLVNKQQSYGSLMHSLGIDAMVNPREMTVSSILQHTRKGKVCAAYSVGAGAAEILEMEMIAHSAVVGKTISHLKLPNSVKIGALIRDGEVIIPDIARTIILEGDHLIVISLTNQVRKMNEIFAARIDYF